MSTRLVQAFEMAAQLHAGQVRKGTSRPYIGHLLGVASIVLQYGADEDVTIAALLHDAVEDQGGAPTLARIRLEFGERVAGIIAACSDTDVIPKPPWRERKEAYIRSLRTAGPDELLVSAADKLHNLRETLADLRSEGDRLWERFRTGREGTLWFHGALLDAFESSGQVPPGLLSELRQTFAAISDPS